jgi:hypothetical protein
MQEKVIGILGGYVTTKKKIYSEYLPSAQWVLKFAMGEL